MADNVTANPGSGGSTFRSTDVAGVHSPHSKVEFGGTGVATQVADSAGNRLPVKTGEVPAGAEADGHSATLGATTDAEAAGNGSVVALLKRLRTLLGGTLTVGGTVTANAGTGFAPVVTDGAAAGTTGLHALGTDGTNAQILSTNASGHVNIADGGNSLTVDGTVAVNATVGANDLLKAEDAAHTTGEAGVFVLGVRDDSGGVLAGTTGDYIPFSMNASGHLRVAAFGSVAQDGAIAGNPVAIAGRASAAAPADVSADNDVQWPWLLRNGSIVANIASGGTLVTIGQKTMANSLPVVLASDQSALNVGGGAAADAAVSGNPLRTGYRASLDEPTAVSADGDAVDGWADRLGRQVIVDGHANPEPPVSINATASGNTTVIAAPGASLSLYIQKVIIVNGGSANQVVQLQDGAGGTARFAAEIAAEGGGIPIDYGARGWKLTANTLLNVNCAAAGDIRVNVTQFYIAA